MKIHSLNDLFLHFLQDIYYAEKQLVTALPKMAKSAEAATLKHAFTAHLQETVHHVHRLEQVFQNLGKPAKAVTCEVMKGLIEEAEEMMDGTEPGTVRDAGLIACGQAVEHHEIARYGALVAWAQIGGHKDIAGLLQQTLDEEKKANETLVELAVSKINKAATALEVAS